MEGLHFTAEGVGCRVLGSKLRVYHSSVVVKRVVAIVATKRRSTCFRLSASAFPPEPNRVSSGIKHYRGISLIRKRPPS